MNFSVVSTGFWLKRFSATFSLTHCYVSPSVSCSSFIAQCIWEWDAQRIQMRVLAFTWPQSIYQETLLYMLDDTEHQINLQKIGHICGISQKIIQRCTVLYITPRTNFFPQETGQFLNAFEFPEKNSPHPDMALECIRRI